MRFVFAILAFAAAAVMIGFGVAQRTVFLEPDRVSLTSTTESDAAYVVVEPGALAAHPGKQTLTAAGTDLVFLAYGRLSDVESWIGDAPYVSVTHDAKTDELVATDSREVEDDGADDGTDGEADSGDGTADDGEEATTDATSRPSPSVTPAPTAEPTPATGDAPATAPATDEPLEADPANSPVGSDLWLDELSGERTVTTTIDVPDDIAVLIASDGTNPAPSRLTLTWPLDNATPWAGPLLLGGGILFLVGIALVISGFLHHRRSRGPRRNLPKGRAGSGPKPAELRRGPIGGGRRAIGRSKRVALVPVLLLPALALTACSPDYWPSFDQPPATTAPATTAPPVEPAPTDDPDADEPVPETLVPAVTVPQMERIMARVAESAATADQALDGDLADERFAGPALEARRANYAIRKTLPDQPGPVPVPATAPTLILPQQVAGWPATGRTVLVIERASDDPTVAPTAMYLQQASPRENYKVVYAMALAPDADVPEVAPASIGAPLISPEFKGLLMQPNQVAAAYADVLLKGDESAYAAMFDPTGDLLREQLGVAGQQSIRAELQVASPTADIAFSNVVGDGPTIALATNDSGALVTATIEQTEKVTPNDGGTIGFQEGAPGAALSGFTGKSAKGVQRIIGIQMVFYVPAVGSDEQIRLLGWSEGLVGASEVP
ncbi:hypothetical protein [Agromyces aureus]|uniref:DUF8094 domain-containing protein n=1 Tax=Agromyces aureus TaxID=453304 RepID=A0A191WF04_9MICO|nr:hypothetical protein [Agromyces aureus]ANJ26759.1 hypothetical protein ATC03_08570 [Agromyces aureus]